MDAISFAAAQAAARAAAAAQATANAATPPPPLTNLLAAGHSIPAGFGLTAPPAGSFPTLLLKMLTASSTAAASNIGAPSSEAAKIISTPWSCYTQVAQATVTAPNRVIRGGYMPYVQAAVLEGIINDFAIHDVGAQAVKGVKNAIRATIAHLLLASKYEDSTSARTTFAANGGTAIPAATSTTTFSGSTIQGLGGNGNLITLDVHVTYPGTPMWIFMRGEPTAGQGCTVDWKINGTGSVVATTDTRDQYSVAGQTNVVATRIPAQTALTHYTIVGTVANFSTAAAFDCWGIEAVHRATVLGLAEPRIPDSSAGAHATWLTARAAANTALSEVFAEFAYSTVQYVDVIDAALGGAPGVYDYFQDDGIHPNFDGHAKIARALYDWVLAHPSVFDSLTLAAAA